MPGRTPPPDSGPLTLAPIGVARTPFAARGDAPRQPAAADGAAGTLELLPGHHYEDALADLDGFERIWVVFWFHGNEGWRPKVLPPRSTTGRKGVFATRSPHRPNPLGLSVLRLERIEGLTLHVRDVDFLDGTPVLDIKPYVPYTDAWPGARSGWLEGTVPSGDAAVGDAPADPRPDWIVQFAPLATAQATWVEDRTGLPLAARITAVLALGPQPHAYRRIRRAGDAWLLAVRDWRARFRVDGRRIEVQSIASGYRPSALKGDAPLAGVRPPAEHMAVHRDFVATWPADKR